MFELLLDTYLIIGLISSFWLAGRFCSLGWGSVTNFIFDTPIVSKIGLGVLMFMHIFAWPITLFVFLKHI